MHSFQKDICQEADQCAAKGAQRQKPEQAEKQRGGLQKKHCGKCLAKVVTNTPEDTDRDYGEFQFFEKEHSAKGKTCSAKGEQQPVW